MKAFSFYILLTLIPVFFKPGVVNITWVDKLTGDYSFAKKCTLQCNAWCYEYAGTNKLITTAGKNDTLYCSTAMNEATHCSLHLTITKNYCLPTIVLTSIAPGGDKVYEHKDGYIKIDSILWKQHILKAVFDFTFLNNENDKNIFWKGKIYTKYGALKRK
ncbi:MAG: hypothetical protein ABIQ31_05945 [Ferruginibacter sp.]